jgi:hypothetical protein
MGGGKNVHADPHKSGYGNVHDPGWEGFSGVGEANDQSQGAKLPRELRSH